jgi:chorismate mutase
MSSPDPSLDLLRKSIDALDVSIHELIMKRGTIVEDIRKIKNRSGPALRPGREAAILRRLVADHRGNFPLTALVCLWREMMGGFTFMQDPLSAAVCQGPGDRLMRIARDHYGSMVAINPLPSPSACIRAVVEGSVGLAIVPAPADGEADSWWRLLMSDDEKTPRVVSRLPFAAPGVEEEAVVVAGWDRDVSDGEASLIAIRLTERASRSRIMAAVATAGFSDSVACATVERDPNDCSHIIEVDGVVPRGDARLAILASQFGGADREAYVVGGYARPLRFAESRPDPVRLA